MKQSWFVYMIETENHLLYTGITTDVEKRFNTHASGKGAKFFRMHRPLKVVFTKKYQTKGKALQREHAMKQLSTTEKRQLIGGLVSPHRSGK